MDEKTEYSAKTEKVSFPIASILFIIVGFMQFFYGGVAIIYGLALILAGVFLILTSKYILKEIYFMLIPFALMACATIYYIVLFTINLHIPTILLNFADLTPIVLMSIIVLLKDTVSWNKCKWIIVLIPIVCFALQIFIVGVTSVYVLYSLALCIAYILTGFWLIDFPVNTGIRTPRVSYENTANIPDELFFCGMGKHVLLLFFTCGIWFYMWIFRMTFYLNTAPDEEQQNPTFQLLLCFIPFYSGFWFYKSSQRLEKLAKLKGLPCDMTAMCVILGIFMPIIAAILVQDKVNTIVLAGGGASATTGINSNTTETTNNTTKNDGVEEIKRYKDLLDSGIITQEEFDAKKKELLGM